MTDSDWVVADSIYGKLVVNRHDFRGQQILRTGIPPGNESIVRLCETLERRCERTGRRQTIIDVGANCGSYALAMARYADRLLAIEPQPELYEPLCQTAQMSLHNIRVLLNAIGHGDRSVCVPALNRSVYHVSDLTKMEPVTVDSPSDRVVYERSIDEIVATHDLGRVDLLKIDTEGMEIDVIEGARDTIATHKPVIFVEFSHCDRFKLQDMLFDLGYPSIQVVDDNDFLCDPDVPWDYRYSYARTALPSLHSPEALYTMERLATAAPRGGLVEVGAYKGGSAQRLAIGAALQPERQCWVYDTMHGVPDPLYALDGGVIKGQWAMTQGEAQAMGTRLQAIANDRVRRYAGRFPTDFDAGAIPEAVAFAHIDCGTHQSTKDSMDALWPRMVSGGIMLMGDYGYPGSKLAADTFVVSPQPVRTMTKEKRLVLTKP